MFTHLCVHPALTELPPPARHGPRTEVWGKQERCRAGWEAVLGVEGVSQQDVTSITFPTENSPSLRSAVTSAGQCTADTGGGVSTDQTEEGPHRAVREQGEFRSWGLGLQPCRESKWKEQRRKGQVWAGSKGHCKPC